MRKAQILLILGVWVTILPYLGFPYSWKEILYTLTGFGIIFFSYILYRDYKEREKSIHKTFDNFRENGDFVEKKHENANQETKEIYTEEVVTEKIN
ncbi:hypothetical protein IT399_02535 [Candidatus Nomurabacteria bacterium]|nr:hypothetical protein [Candidatus Nomurabacteria bacterium]